MSETNSHLYNVYFLEATDPETGEESFIGDSESKQPLMFWDEANLQRLKQAAL